MRPYVHSEISHSGSYILNLCVLIIQKIVNWMTGGGGGVIKYCKMGSHNKSSQEVKFGNFHNLTPVQLSKTEY